MYKLIIYTFILSFYSHFLAAEEKAEDLCFSKSEQHSLVDDSYHYLNTKFCQPALWFDSFFADQRITKDARAGTMVRWYNDFVWLEGEGFSYVPNISARLYLPKTSKKFKIVFESDTTDTIKELFPDDESEQPKNALGLSYDVSVKTRSTINIKATFRPGLEVSYRYIYPFTQQTLWRFTQKIYQQKMVTGEITGFDIDHSFNQKFLLRWSNFAKLDTDVEGLQMGTGFTLYHYISPTQALNYRASISAKNKPYHYIDNTHLGLTYRQNIIRSWFFYELSPEINWPKNSLQEKSKDVSFTLRLEVMFKNI
ncbi:MAG: hypothetical protein ACJAZP_000308 [Psychromonas sp.]|uniref:hypothetical protein n=1 Tax=Psychromonas sp. TaxID=1884585 RepID=UPI0039E267AD